MVCASPAAPTPPECPQSNASLARRLGALVYEALMLGALLLIAGFVLAPAVSPAASAAHTLQIPSFGGRMLSFAGIFSAAMVYCVWSWSEGRSTLPMKTWRLSLQRVDGGRLTRGSALRRYLACWIGPALALLGYVALRPLGVGAHAAWLMGLNFLWALIDRDRQFLHDRIAGTRLVDEARPRRTAVSAAAAVPARPRRR